MFNGETGQDIIYIQIAKNILKISNLFPCFQNFMINWENLINIGRAGDNTSNQETPDEIERVGVSDCLTFLCYVKEAWWTGVRIAS